MKKMNTTKLKNTNILKNTCSTVLLIAIFFLICFAAGLYVSGKSNGACESVQKYYTSIRIKEGDSLWELAEFYTRDIEHTSIEGYLNEVKVLNNLKDTTIYTDAYLTIPYFVSE